MHSLLQPANALVDPVDGVPASVAARRWVWPLLLLSLCMIFSGVAFALRWDAGPPTIARLTDAGELAGKTERELEDAIRQAWRIALVGGVAKGVFLAPLLVLLLSVAVKVSLWLASRPLKFGQVFSIVAVAMLPIAVFHLLYGAVALAWEALTVQQAMRLLPSHLGHWLGPGLIDEGTPLSRVASVVDLFNLWAALLLGLGISAGTGMSRTRGVLFALFLYLAFAGVFLIGLPGMGGGK